MVKKEKTTLQKLAQKVEIKKILKPSQVKVRIKEVKDEYVPVYFKGELEEMKRSMFFK